MGEDSGGIKMTMLHIINLFVIDKIFTEVAEIKLSPMSKMLYINCLTHHFKERPASFSGAIAFELKESDIPKYDSFIKYFQELHDAQIVTISSKSIFFNNVWSKFIDRTKLEKVSPEEYVAGYVFKEIKDYKDDLLKSQKLVELLQMKYKLSKNQITQLINLFITEQSTYEKKYPNLSECLKHCGNWIAINLDKVPKENVKSTGKILGAE